jgi:hypothetical protein
MSSQRRLLVTLAVLMLPGAAAAQDVTFTRDVAPIVFEACVPCHRPNGPGPFPLTTYDEVRRRAAPMGQREKSRFGSCRRGRCRPASVISWDSGC